MSQACTCLQPLPCMFLSDRSCLCVTFGPCRSAQIGQQQAEQARARADEELVVLRAGGLRLRFMC